MKNLNLISTACILIGLTAGCGTGVSSPFTYSSTSTTGDYAEWTVTGSNLSVVWKVTDTSGAIAQTFNVSATCGAPDATYNYKTCTIDTASCTDGTSACSGTPSGTFETMEVPGVALFVHTGSGTSNEQLHVGILADTGSCGADVSGDYTYVRAGAGNDELFGMYRTDAHMNSVVHGEFKMDNAGSATATDPVTVKYTTGSGTGDGHDTLSGDACSNGVRQRTLSSGDLRIMATQSGLFVLDLPSGQGGIISFKTSKAASLADLANKEFGGITFSDDGNTRVLSATTAGVSGDAVNIAVKVKGEGDQTRIFRPFSSATSTMTLPAFPSFTAAPTGWSNNDLASTYATPADIPGMFKIDGDAGGDTGRTVGAFMKFNGKVIGFGVNYNFRANGTSKPGGGTYSADGVYNTGNFIVFEK